MFKKMFVAVLAIIMCLSTSVTAFADGGGKQTPPVTLAQPQTVDANDEAVFAIKNNGELWAVSETTSVKVLDDCVTVSTAPNQAFAVKADGTAWKFSAADTFTAQQILADVPKILQVYADYGASDLYAISETGVLYRYNWRDNTPAVELISGVQAISGSGEIFVLKNDGTLWHWSEAAPTPAQVIDGAQETTEKLFTKRAETIRREGAGMGQQVLYIDENGALQYDGMYIDEASGEFFGLGRLEVAQGIAAFVSTDEIVILRKDGVLLSGAYVDFGELVGEFKEILSDVRLPETQGAIATTPQPTAAIPVQLTTETPSAWAVEQVNQAVAAGLVPQELQSKYVQPTTRAEFCALAVAVYESVKGEITERKTFTDTEDTNVQKMAAIGIISGTNAEGTQFSPNNPLTREQAAVILARLANVIGKPFTSGAAVFSDNGNISAYAVESVGQLQAAGIMGDTGGNNFSPQAPYTREQSITTIFRVFNAVK